LLLAIHNEGDMTPRTPLILALTVGAFALTSCAPDENPTEPTAGGDELSAAPSFALAANSWTARARMPTGRGRLALAVANSGGKPILYAIGGDEGKFSTDTVEAYNVATNTWSLKAPLPAPLTSTNGVGHIAGKLYVAGGLIRDLDDKERPDVYVNSLYAYDILTNTWSRKADMPRPMARGISGVINDKLYVLTGGCGQNQCTDYVTRRLYVYDPVTNTWDGSAPWCPDAHLDGAGGVINGKFYVAGGTDRNSSRTRLLHVYDPATRRWTTKAPMPAATSLIGAAVLGNKLYVIGGYVGFSSVTNTVVAYDPVSDRWTTKASMPTARAGLAAIRATLDGQSRIYAIGGLGAFGHRHEAYTP
jgi:N-acetylneuraminic acid mutarotase